jgi:hypothetical protein
VSQISPPIRIVLVLAVATAALYMLFLRPKSEVAPPAAPAPNVETSAPAVSKPGKAAEAAQGAVAAVDAHTAAQEGVDGVDAGETATAAGTTAGTAPNGTATPAAVSSDLKGLPKPIAKAIRRHKYLVLLFWNGKSADDRAVRDALRKVDRWDGRVHTEVASIRSISKYGRIARGVDVEQSPTIVVADPQLRAETLVGYVNAPTINQAVVDAMVNSEGVYTSAYLREIHQVCAQYSRRFWATKRPDDPREGAAYLTRGTAMLRTFGSHFKAVPAPKRFRSLRRATLADTSAVAGVYADWAAYVGSNPSASRYLAGIQRYMPRVRTISKRFDRRMDDAHVLACGTN